MGDVVKLRDNSGDAGNNGLPSDILSQARQALRFVDCMFHYENKAQSKGEKGKKRADAYKYFLPQVRKHLRMGIKNHMAAAPADLSALIAQGMGPDATIGQYIGARKMLTIILAALPDYSDLDGNGDYDGTDDAS